MTPELAAAEMPLRERESQEGVDLMPRNLVQGILYFKCLDLGLIKEADHDGIASLFRKTNEIINAPDDSYSKLVRGEIEAGDYEKAAEQIIQMIFPDVLENPTKIKMKLAS